MKPEDVEKGPRLYLLDSNWAEEYLWVFAQSMPRATLFTMNIISVFNKSLQTVCFLSVNQTKIK